MWFLIGTQLFLIALFAIMGWAIVKKELYGLISNFNGRSDEEQRQLIENGYPQRVGKLMVATAAGMAVLLPLNFTSFDYSMDIQFGFMLIFMLGGLVYLSKYELPSKRKRSYLISSIIAVSTIGFIGVLVYAGYKDFELKAKEESFVITGMYGDEWQYAEIEDVRLMDKMPTVTWKQNGFGLSTMAKGQFTVENYGSSLLFIHKGSPPYLYIELKDKRIFINSKQPEKTIDWHEKLKSASTH